MSEDRALVERLRAYAKDQGGWHNIDETCEDAAAAIERLTVERDTAISQATWANHAAECAEAAAGAMAEQRDEARLRAKYETDVAAAEIEGRKAAEDRVTLLEKLLSEHGISYEKHR